MDSQIQSWPSPQIFVSSTGGGTPTNGFVNEDGTTFFVNEDGTTYFVNES